jgi:large subunit ribosomal protein L1
MAKLTKKAKEIAKLNPPGKIWAIDEALSLLAKMPKAKFDESVELAVNLGVDPRKSDQVVRGSSDLPFGTGKQVRVAVFTQGANVEAARNAGADIVGMEDLAESIKQGNINFDVVIASPDTMRVVGQLGQILGPRGLMPNPKVGTVTADVAGAVRSAKAGQVRFRTDKAGIIHCAVGKISFASDSLKANIQAVLTELQKLKPATSKGIYVKRITVSTTQGPGIAVDTTSVIS